MESSFANPMAKLTLNGVMHGKGASCRHMRICHRSRVGTPCLTPCSPEQAFVPLLLMQSWQLDEAAQSLAACPAGQACVLLSSLAPDFASAMQQLSNAVLHFESVSSLQPITPRPASSPERPLDHSKIWRCRGTSKSERSLPVSWLPSVVHWPLQASAGAGSGASNKAKLTQRIMLAQLQSAVYEDIAAATSLEGLSVLGLRLPGRTHAVLPELSPGQCFLYEDSMGSGLPSAQERRCALSA